jgi:hypothetical protein
MAVTYRRIAEGGAPPRRRKAAPVRLATAQDAAAQSPALHRQALLQESFQPPGDLAKWSQRRTLAFVGLTCGGFWTCVIVGLAHLAHHG